MAEPVVEQAPAAPAPSAPPPAAERFAGLNDEQIMARAIGEQPAAAPQPRDASGKFASATPPAPATPPAQTPAAETTEQPAATTAAEAAPEYKWDEVKGIKLKVPMKREGKEWEDEVTLEQLRNERMMHTDYQARRKEIEEQGRQHEAKAREAVERERQAHLGALETLHKQVMAMASGELPQTDAEWAQLANDNPADYVRKLNKAREVNSRLERIKHEHEKVQQQAGKERDERLARNVAESRQKLLEAIPTWTEDTYQSVLKRGVETYGFTREDIGQVWDHRVMRLLHDAHQFRLLNEARPNVEKRVEAAPPVLKPGTPKPKVSAQESRLSDAQARLRKDGNDRDAATDLMAAFITPRK